MSLVVEITDYTPDGSQEIVIGRFILQDGKVIPQPESGQEQYMDRLLESPVTVPKVLKTVTASGNPEAWLKALPANYSGTRTRASLVVDKRVIESLHDRADRLLQSFQEPE
jgi:hypothetical protein